MVEIITADDTQIDQNYFSCMLQYPVQFLGQIVRDQRCWKLVQSHSSFLRRKVIPWAAADPDWPMHVFISITDNYSIDTVVDNPCNGSHPLLDTHVISWKSWARHCFGGYFRTTPMIRPNSLTLPRTSGIPMPLLPDRIGSMLSLEPQVPHHYWWQVHNPLGLFPSSSDYKGYFNCTGAAWTGSLRKKLLLLVRLFCESCWFNSSEWSTLVMVIEPKFVTIGV